MFLTNTVVTNDTANAPPSVIQTLQTSTPINTQALSAESTQAITGIASVTGSANTALTDVTSSVSKLTTSITSSATNYLQSALKSVTSTFSGTVTGLASGISSSLTDIFKDTNVKTASTTTSLISDPVKTNLLDAKTPSSTAFKISSSGAGSQTIDLTGANSIFGTNASSMQGTTLSTLLNRLNLDSSSNLVSSLTNAKSSLSLGGLFSDAASLVKVVQTVAAVPTAAAASVLTGLNNDLQSFLGRTSALSNITGVNTSSYFIQNPSNSLVDANGTAVNTLGSGVDSSTANSLLELAKVIGCPTDTLNYNSANEIDSLFNLIMSQAASLGMSSLISSLLGCSQASTTQGQVALTNAFVASAGTNPTIASSIVAQIDNPATLNDDLIMQSVVTNPSLSAADKSSIDYIMESVGTTTTKAYSVSSISTDDSPVFNLATLSQSNSSFLDSAFDSTDLSTYIGGYPLSLQSDGSLWV